MSETTLRVIISGVLLFHAVGQLMGLLPVFHFLGSGTAEAPKWAKNWSAFSWLLTKKKGKSVSNLLCFLLYLSAFILFVFVVLSLNGWVKPHAIWQTFAIIAAVIFLTALFLFWNGFILLFPHKIGNIAVNVTILTGLLVFNWLSEFAIGF